MRQLKAWWNGNFVAYENDPNSGVFLVGGHYKRHWTASVVRAAWAFFQTEWKWVITVGLTACGLLMTYIRFF